MFFSRTKSAPVAPSTTLADCKPVQRELVGTLQRLLVDLTGSVTLTKGSVMPQYTLQLYGCSDAQTLGIFNQSLRFRLKEQEDGSRNASFSGSKFGFENSKCVPAHLHVDVYATGSDDEDADVVATKIIGHASFDLATLAQEDVTAAIKDIEGGDQGSITLKQMVGISPLNVHQPDQQVVEDSKRLASKLVASAQKGYDTLTQKFKPRAVQWNLASFGSVDGRLPILAFVYGTTRIVHDTKQSERFLLHLMQLAGCMLGRKPEEFATLKDADPVKGDWLAEMCSLYFRGQVYCRDTVLASKGRSMETDCWSRLNCFPADGLTAFDCEDGAEWILELLMLLKRGVFESVLLRSMQTFAACFTACFALGEIDTKPRDATVDEYVPHVFVILLDKRYMQKPSAKMAYLPAIAIESTTYTQGAWDFRRTQADEFSKEWKAYEEIMQLFFTQAMIEHSDRYKRVCKTTAAVAVVSTKAMYRNVFALVTVDTDTGEGKHLLITCKSDFGATVADLLLYQPTVLFHVVAAVPADKWVLFDAMLAHQPLGKLPDAPSNPSYPVKGKNAQRFLIRGADYKANADTFAKAGGELIQFEQSVRGLKQDAAAKTFETAEEWTAMPVPITDKVLIYVVDV
jgi:hypothetical protein